MTSPSPNILHFALRQLLANWLQKSKFCFSLGLSAPVHSDADEPTHQEPPSLVYLYSKDIPLNRIRSNPIDFSIHYVSAIAMRLGQRHPQSPALLAQELEADFQQFQAADQAEPQDKILQNFIASTTASGWLHFQLSEAGTAQWLQQLLDASLESGPILQSNPVELDPRTAPVFQLFVAHARCWTLLRRAKSQGELTFHTPDWLDSAGKLRCQQSVEWELIAQIIDTLDYLTGHQTSVRQTLKVAVGLSEAFQTFDAGCRIWGETQQNRPLTEVRLGLVQIVQTLLRLLLEQNLGLPAPTEL